MSDPGSAPINSRRGKRFLNEKERLERLHNPEKCPCRKKKCERHKNCEACIAYHHGRGGLPACERK
jgi:hypothetical protein